jgi:hypothetical protein
MLDIDFPFLATAISGALAFFLGLFWYHPKILGTRWLEARGVTLESTKPSLKYFIISMALWMIAACFYSFMTNLIGIDEIPGYFSLSCLLWVAFAMPPLLMGAFYTGYAFEAVSIDAAYQLAGYYVFAVTHLVIAALGL